jgi:hypothetical protein
VKNEQVNGLNGAKTIFGIYSMPHGFAFCDVAKYSMMRLEIFYHVDKGSM